MVKNLEELQIGNNENVYVLLKSIENVKKVDSNYQILTIVDMFCHKKTVMNFGSPIDSDFAPSVVKMELQIKEYCNKPSYIFVNIKKIENANISDFNQPENIDYKESWKNIVHPLKDIRIGLKTIVQNTLKESQKSFLIKGLTNGKSFSRRRGILEATEQLVKLAEVTSTVCKLDKDLMIAGSILYFIGHTDTIDDALNVTEDDELFGSGVLAQNKVMFQYMKLLEECESKKCENEEQEKEMLDLKNDLLSDDIKKLSHILLSRTKGIYATTPEALALRSLASMVMNCDELNDAIKNKRTSF